MVSLAHAKDIIAAAEQKAEELQVRIAVVVLDQGGSPVAMHKMDGAYLSTPHVAMAKAYTAVNFGQPTHELAATIPPDRQASVVALDSRLTFLKGGIPIVIDGEVRGGVGVSGSSSELDQACAEAGAAARPAAASAA